MLITRMELSELNDAELSALYETISRAFWRAEAQSMEWYCFMASLENIRGEQGRRRWRARPKPRGPGF